VLVRPKYRILSCAFLAIVALLTSLLVAPQHVSAAPPPNPSDGQLTAAQQQKQQLADQVGALSAQVAQIQAQVQNLNLVAEVAEQKMALALQQLQDAKDAATQASANVVAAQNAVVAARQRFADYVRTTYMSSPVSGTAGQLLTASDPASLLQGGDYLNYTAGHQLDAIGQMNEATVAKSNADAQARATVQAQQKATTAATQAEQSARAAVASAQAQQAQLNTTLATQQAALQTAQATLATLNNQRAAYDAYVAQQAAIAAAAAAAAALAAQQAAAARAAHSGSNASSTPSNGGGPAPVSGGSWTAAAGQAAVARAESYLGWPYSWAAGNSHGPTYGVNDGGSAFRDSQIKGFDCSGLVMYAWAQISLPHSAESQYTAAGHMHPAISDLLPGDLVFWSDNGAQSGIGHVAIYIGGGNVIQAPESGDVIKITNVYHVESGMFGATRPLT
jgi:peptidoglycan DL-endopeptidase RipA